MSREQYTVIVSGERFHLTKDQILSNPGSFFETYFFGDFAEAASGTRELEILKEPLLFKLIQAHLRGYEILPLASSVIPPYMTPEAALLNLYREANYYGLQKLEESIRSLEPNIGKAKAGIGYPRVDRKKRYKLAKFDEREWRFGDITKEACDRIMQRLSSGDSGHLEIHEDLVCPGFIQIIGWREINRHLSEDCALLEST